MTDITTDGAARADMPVLPVQKAQRTAMAALCLGIAALVALFWPTVTSAIHLWDTSSSYTHGYLIAPVSAYLIWIERDALRSAAPRPTLLGVASVGAFAAAWMLADLLGINEGRHFAFVGMLQGLFLAVLGISLYWRLLFSLNYLWLMVPAGEFLIAPLQTIAHAGATVLLQFSGMSVFAEGLIIQVPSGNFLVEPGCAGLNFFLTALALSLVYGRLVYQTTSARVLCVAVALVTSVLANIVRIYLIIALTEWTDAKLDIAADHLVFGWGFFSVIMLALMWAGIRLAKPHSETSAEKPSAGPSAPVYVGAIPVALVCSLAMAALAPALSAAVMRSDAGLTPHIALPHDIASWRRAEISGDWRPEVVPADAMIGGSYVAAGGPRIDIAAAMYAAERQGHEAAAAGNRPYTEGWQPTGGTVRAIKRGDTTGAIAITHLRRGSETRLTASWYETGACISASRLRAKVCTLRERLTGGSTAGAFVAISADAAGNIAETEGALAAFAESLPPVLPRGRP